MTRLMLVAVLGALVVPMPPSHAQIANSNSATRTPVLVELFTSEGCSSCPPADKFLEDLEAQQPIPGADLIVLSEHVDYWNHDGWQDPFSSHSITERQNSYAERFKINSAYTPQMIVDGEAQFVGNSPSSAKTAFEKASTVTKLPVRLSSISFDGNKLRAHISVASLPAAERAHADVYVALALNHAESQVLRGENGGHRLSHVAVVRTLTKVGSVAEHRALDADIQLRLDSSDDRSNLRLVAFIQQPGPGKVLGATVERVVK